MDQSRAVHALSALAQDTRLEVFRRLVQAGPEGLTAGALAEALELPAATLSFHLKELRNAALVRCDRAGRCRIYRPHFAAVRSLVHYLTENCCRGAGTACGRRKAGRRAR